MFDIKNTIRKFILGEGITKPSTQSLLENLSKILEILKPHSLRETRYLEIAKHNIREIRSGVKKLEEEKKILEERVKLLEESKEKKLRRK